MRPIRVRAVLLGAGAFTLLEVLLALSIAIGLLIVVLYYYQQAALLRDSTLDSATGLAAVRLCMDRLGTELRTASAQPDSLRGGSQEIEFLQCELPESGNAAAAEDDAPVSTPVLLRRIRYAMRASEESSAAGGLVRTETVVTPAAPGSGEPEPDSVETDPAETGVVEESSEPPDTNDVWAVETASVEEEGTRITTSFPSAGAPPLTIPELRYLRLRYWDGAQWQDSWSGSHLPRGIEVTLALEPVPPDAAPDTLPEEVFRRVIAIPAGLAWSAAPAVADDFESGSVNGEMTSEGGR